MRKLTAELNTINVCETSLMTDSHSGQTIADTFLPDSPEESQRISWNPSYIVGTSFQTWQKIKSQTMLSEILVSRFSRLRWSLFCVIACDAIGVAWRSLPLWSEPRWSRFRDVEDEWSLLSRDLNDDDGVATFASSNASFVTLTTLLRFSTECVTMASSFLKLELHLEMNKCSCCVCFWCRFHGS